MKTIRAIGVSLLLSIGASCAMAQTYAFTTWAGRAACGTEDGPIAAGAAGEAMVEVYEIP